MRSSLSQFISESVQPIDMYLAQTVDHHSQGFQNIMEVPFNTCILFVFPQPVNGASFWMKSTFIDLDIAFIDDNFNVIETRRMYAHDLNHTRCDQPVRYVLESTAGWMRHMNIKVGTNLSQMIDSNVCKIHNVAPEQTMCSAICGYQ